MAAPMPKIPYPIEKSKFFRLVVKIRMIIKDQYSQARMFQR